MHVVCADPERLPEGFQNSTLTLLVDERFHWRGDDNPITSSSFVIVQGGGGRGLDLLLSFCICTCVGIHLPIKILKLGNIIFFCMEYSERHKRSEVILYTLATAILIII